MEDEVFAGETIQKAGVFPSLFCTFKTIFTPSTEVIEPSV